MLRLLRPASLASLLVLFLLLTGAAQSSQPLTHLQPATHNACVDTFVRSMRTMKAEGVWACLSKQAQNSYFLANGWNSDADITAWMQSLVGGSVGFRVDYYAGNPVRVCSPLTGNCQTAYLIYVTPVASDGTQVGSSVGVTITIAGGLIDHIGG